MEQIKKFAFDVGWVFLSSVVTLLIGFLLRVVLARWLGPADLGLYTMVITIQGVASLLVGLGIPVAVIKYTAEQKDDRDRLLQTTFAAFIISIIFGLVVGALLFALSETLAGVFNMPELAHLLRILAFMLPFASALEILLGLFNGLRQMKTYAYLVMLRSFLMILLVVVLVWQGFGVEGAVFGIVFSIVGGFIFGLYFARKLLRPNLRGLFQGARRLVSFGSQAFVADALGMVLVYTDTIMIGYFLAAEDVGYYGIAVSLSRFFILVPMAIQRITFPATSEYWAKTNHRALATMIDKSMKYAACILLPLGLGVGFFAEDVVTIVFGQEFIYAISPLLVLLAARIITGCTVVPVGGSFAGVGRPDLPLKFAAINVVVNVGLNILLIPLWGIVGAAIATAVSSLLGATLFLVYMPRVLGVMIDLKWYALAFGFACIAVAIFFGGIQLVNLYVVGSVILCGFIVLVFNVLLTKEDRAILGSLVSSSMRRR